MRCAIVVAVCGLVATGADAAEPVERRLWPDEVEASSFLWNNWNKFQED